MVAPFRLPQRLRKFIGTLIIVPYTVLYALVAMALAVRILPGQPVWIEVIFFVVGGLAWLPPAMWLISWMSKADA